MDNFICGNCNFSLTIKKSTENIIIKITTPNELINASKVEEHQLLDIKLEKVDLETFLTKKNIKEVERKRIMDFYIEKASQKKIIAIYNLVCSTCGTEYLLNPETIIYSINFKKQSSSYNDDDIDLRLYDQTLPRTKDYICPNSKCETNDKKFDNANKEAVFYRAYQTYHMKYACLNCKASWII
jgi:hypothetical protein